MKWPNEQWLLHWLAAWFEACLLRLWNFSIHAPPHPTPPAPHPFTPPSPPTHLLSESYRLSATADSRSRSCFFLGGQVERRHVRGELKLHFRFEKAVCVSETFSLPADLHVAGVPEDEFRHGAVVLADRLQHGLLDVLAVAQVQQQFHELRKSRSRNDMNNGVYKPTSLSMIWIMAFYYQWYE